jgi:FkbM family methyltransferase
MKQSLNYENKQYELLYHNDLIQNIVVSSNTFFEEWLLTPLKEKVNSFDFVLDIGSNIGNHAYFFKNICDSSRTICFEPLPDNLELLKINCNNCEIYPVALSSENKLGFIKNSDGINNNSGTACLSDDGIQIELKTLDSFNFENITFIKIDVEGHELEVIKGGLNTINKYKPDILVEIHTGITIENVLELLPNYNWEKISYESHYLLKPIS